MKRLVLLALVLLSARGLGADSCTPQYSATRVMPNTIVVNPSGFPPELQGAAAAGAAMWNASSCNKGGFPQIQMGGGTGGLPTISMAYANNSVGVGVCGEFRPETSTIVIYPRVKPTATSTATYSCGSADVVAQNIAHELGHVLGVGDTLNSCLPGDKNFIMSPIDFTVHADGSQTFTQRSVQPSECNVANMVNVTIQEGGVPPHGGNGQTPQQQTPAPPNGGAGGATGCVWANFCVTTPGAPPSCSWYCI